MLVASVRLFKLITIWFNLFQFSKSVQRPLFGVYIVIIIQKEDEEKNDTHIHFIHALYD